MQKYGKFSIKRKVLRKNLFGERYIFLGKYGVILE